MHGRMLLVTLWITFFLFPSNVSLSAAGSNELLPCPGSVPGFILKRLPEAGPPEGDRGEEALAETQAQSGTGNIRGGINSSPADVTFDRRGATVAITGGINASPVDLQIDRATGAIKGGANGSKVELTVRSNPECTTIMGGANRSPVEIRIDWKKRILSGHSNHSAVRVEFQPKEGTEGTVVNLKGYANHAPVKLTYDQRSRRLTGGMDHAKANLTFTNVTLEEFIEYFFLFNEA